MNYILFSDIHSNLEAYHAFLDRVKPLIDGGAELICLGDIVGYGGNPSECVQLTQNIAKITISGNHERMLIHPEKRYAAVNAAVKAIEWTEEVLEPQQMDWLNDLPEMQTAYDGYLFVHGSPRDPDEYIFSSSHALRSFSAIKEAKARICFHGHTHIPGIYDEKGVYYYQDKVRLCLDSDIVYLINPGSIGQPRDGDPRGSYCVFSDEGHCVVFFRFEYDMEKAAEKIRKAGLPGELADRLRYGR